MINIRVHKLIRPLDSGFRRNDVGYASQFTRYLGAPGRDSQGMPSLSPSRLCASNSGPPYSMNSSFASRHVSKSEQFISTNIPAS